MVWFKKQKSFLTINTNKKEMPEGVWRVCDGCSQYVTNEEIKRNLHTCPKCNHYYVMPVQDRIQSILDEGSFEEFDVALASRNPLDFDNYDKKLLSAQKKTGRYEGMVTGRGAIETFPVIFGALDFSFMGGSMGSVVGEKITRAAERALNDEIPLVLVSTGGGGARMHEGMLSLMQMAKTSAAMGRLKKHGIPFISIICHPTMGGVAASFAALGDVIIAEPKALIGFAGPRVIEQTIGQQLPEGFQRAEFLLEHGMIDMIVKREELRQVLKPILNHLWYNPMMVMKSRYTEEREAQGFYAVKR
ncbi:MAG: acetyl-CoA carboxylase, carboxyltransferase subunit beta [bacterium]|jgi:acetyl-CoA carboxylase carboxyl transferase subunit beta